MPTTQAIVPSAVEGQTLSSSEKESPVINSSVASVFPPSHDENSNLDARVSDFISKCPPGEMSQVLKGVAAKTRVIQINC